eukprot:9513499-Alexandrium_andersonii.AAC.1
MRRKPQRMHWQTGVTPEAPAEQPRVRCTCAVVPVVPQAANEHPPPAGAPAAPAPEDAEGHEVEVDEAELEERGQ